MTFWRRRVWDTLDYFVVPLRDGTFSIGQVIERKHADRELGAAVCSFYDKKIASTDEAVAPYIPSGDTQEPLSSLTGVSRQGFCCVKFVKTGVFLLRVSLRRVHYCLALRGIYIRYSRSIEVRALPNFRRRPTMLKSLTIACVLVLFSLPAWADCEADLVKIYEQLETVDVADDDMAKINEMLDQAEAAQTDGNEDACIAGVAEASSLVK